MIYESSYWKDDLLKLASRLERRLIQSRWGEKNFYTLEKEIFFGFYSIRKLIESQKVSDSLKLKSYEIRGFPHQKGGEPSIEEFNGPKYDFGNAGICKLTILQLCNQFIHSYHFVPFISGGKNLIGFFFCSDLKKKSWLYFINVFDVVEIYRAVGQNYSSSIYIERLPNGSSVSKIE